MGTGLVIYKKAGTIILLSTIVLWFLQGFGWVDGRFAMLEAEQLEHSILAAVGGLIAPVLHHLAGVTGRWRLRL